MLDLPGGDPQGCNFGLLGYKSYSNDNASHIPTILIYKFVDEFNNTGETYNPLVQSALNAE